MANTVIQLKYSTVTATPPSLNVAEPAYSYASNTFFIGSPTGTGVIAIGGKFYLDQQQDIYNLSNAAFVHANAAFASANNSTKANAAFDHANAAFIHANSGFIQANASFNHANAGFNAANTADSKAVSAGSYANSAFVHSNSAFIEANAAFTRANNSLNANTGGTITGTLVVSGDLDVTGNLIITGNTITQNVTTLNISDPLIYLAANNYSSDVVEIGFAANYYDGATQRHTGIFREASNKEYYVFDNYDKEPDANLIDINDASFRIATLHANLKSQLITLNGQNLQTYVDNSYAAANTADSRAVSAGSYANSAFVHSNSAFIHANSGFNHANSGFTQANAAFVHANSSFNHANAAFDVANTDVTGVSITAAHYGTASSVPAFRVEANGRISSANSTSIAIAASQITSGELSVSRGGTGVASLTLNGVVLGQGTSAVTTASSSTEGHVLTINNSGVPTFAHLSGGTF
jgi:hypothetical protein